MKYTEKYKLPQWEASDRVLMDDFNQMCRRMEDGLELRGQAARETLEKGLFRAAFNHYQYLVGTNSFPTDCGVWFRDYYERNGSSIQNATSLNKRWWCSGAREQLTLELLRATLTAGTACSATNDTCSVTFTPPCSGILVRARLEGGYQNNTSGNTGDCTITLRNLTKGTTEATADGNLGLRSGSSTYSVSSLTEMVLHAKQRYQLSVKLKKLDFTPAFYFDIAGSCLEFRTLELGDTCALHNFSWDMPSSGGLFFVHYNTWGTGNSLTVSWPEDSEPEEPAVVRRVYDRHSRWVQEAEFRISRDLPASGTAKINFNCAPDGEFEIFETGGILI